LSHPQVLTVVPGMGTREQARQAADYLRHPVPQQLWDELRAAGLIRPDAPVPSAKLAG
jgi:D-threo-aldose 1-dehydrogenase